MITIGVLSDTHLPKKGKELPVIVQNRLQGGDWIIHAGDRMRLADTIQLEWIYF
ncbi:metallophosphoesterase family protein [Effusibacillus pohliae]|uniref:hypothetical protein n=1 Tax=Effusibacillus pohliae TaxID=232270 RepID=UPI000367365B|nr:hypothetical protein [Effusibacillus pohliae]